ncbi:DUF2325 domain-containing protein [Variovorax sp. Sphag1AA]|uniref:DUF2325 domain-containing protein n=1 Tax=Variovorax sp. Sphag1AA TaxID=2587027 RepID=UPI001614C29C|nr:DUF2325 domain-containing protein [Variovorax sp. Sphag1AA]MBB3181237.1 hypothetical protein [Variovorax sp. Sphag1AA]
MIDYDPVDQLIDEHLALVRHYGQVQMRCGDLVREQAAEIEKLRAQTIRLRAAVIVRDTALAWAQEYRASLEASIPGLPRRKALAQRVDALLARIQELMRERLHWQRRSPPEHAPVVTAMHGPVDVTHRAEPEAEVEDLADLESSLVAADLVICQTGCLSHGAYWRVQDLCRRTGKACVLVQEPDAIRIVRIDRESAREQHDA